MAYRSMAQFKKDWVEALRSGEYKKTEGALCRPGKKYDEFCCLGVAADLLVRAGHRLEWQDPVASAKLMYLKSSQGKTAERLGGHAPAFLTRWLKHSPYSDWREREDILIRTNDSGGSFREIADIIESWE